MRSAALKLPDGRWLAGDAARDYVNRHPEMAKRLLTAFKPLLMLPERGQTRWQAEVVAGELRDDPKEKGTIRVGGGTRYVLRTESLTSSLCPPGMTLADVRQATREMLHAVHLKVREAQPRLVLDHLVIGIPVGFPDLAKAKVIEAAVDAGLVRDRGRVTLFPEPVAVGLAYGIEFRTPKRVLVFDHGGGTLDMTILDISGDPAGGDFHYQVLAQVGHDRAGRYYDRLLLARVIDMAGSKGKEALRYLGVQDPMAIAVPGYLDEAERVKEALFSGSTRARSRPVQYAHVFGDVSLRQEVTEETMAEVLRGELEAVRAKVEQLVAQAEVNAALVRGRGQAGVEEILLAGGSARLPFFRTLLEEMFPGVPIDDRYAGTRTTTAGFARAVQYRGFIGRLTDTEYRIFVPDEWRSRTVLPIGTPLSEATAERQQGRRRGLYLRAEHERATVLLFSVINEREQLQLQAVVEGIDPGDKVQVFVTVDPVSGQPSVRAVSAGTGLPLPVRTVDPYGPEGVPLLEKGQIIRFCRNQIRNHPSRDTGCIDTIVCIADGRPRDLAVGEMTRFRLALHHPSGALPQVRAAACDIEVYEVELPRPGQSVVLDRLSDRDFKPLPGGELYPFSCVPAPVDEEQPASAPAAAALQRRREEVLAEQPTAAEPAAEQAAERSGRRRVGARLLELLRGEARRSGS
jgi:hypothetical protein